MKSAKRMLIAALVVALIWIAGYTGGALNANGNIVPAKVGVVSITQILQDSQKHKQWQEQMSADETRLRNEFAKLKAELDMIQADMKSYKRGSDDYNKLQREYAEKSALREARDRYYEQEMIAKAKDWTERLYSTVEEKIAQVAAKKGLDVVLAKQNVDLPAASMQDLLLSIKTNNVLYHSNALDITKEVLAAVDAAM